MSEALVLLVSVAAPVAVMAGLWRLGLRVRRHGGDLMGPFEEIWHPGAHRFRSEVREYEQRMAPVPPADDRWRAGRAHLDRAA